MSSNRYDIRSGAAQSSQSLSSVLLENVKLLYVTDAQFSEDWHSTMHSHPNLELFYCVRGIGEFRMQDKVLPVGSDDMIIVNPNVEHTETSVPSNPLAYIALGISGVDLIFNAQDQQCSVLNYRGSRTEIVALLRMLISEASNQPQGWENVCQHLLVVLLSLLLRHTHFTLNIEQGLHTNKECAAARRFIDEHFAEPIDLETLSNITHVNKYYLAHSFKREYGISPINYLIERRIRGKPVHAGTYGLCTFADRTSARFFLLQLFFPEFPPFYRTKPHGLSQAEPVCQCGTALPRVDVCLIFLPLADFSFCFSTNSKTPSPIYGEGVFWWATPESEPRSRSVRSCFVLFFPFCSMGIRVLFNKSSAAPPGRALPPAPFPYFPARSARKAAAGSDRGPPHCAQKNVPAMPPPVKSSTGRQTLPGRERAFVPALLQDGPFLICYLTPKNVFLREAGLPPAAMLAWRELLRCGSRSTMPPCWQTVQRKSLPQK